MKMKTGCPRKIEKINICMKSAKIAFKLLMKIWDSVYIFFFVGSISCKSVFSLHHGRFPLRKRIRGFGYQSMLRMRL